MLVLLKTEDGRDKAVNLDNAEFEVQPSETDASMMHFKIFKNNELVIESMIREETYHNILETLQGQNKIIIANHKN